MKESSFFRELDQDSGHVIHTVLVATVLGDEFIKKVLAYEFELSLIESGWDPCDHFLVGLDFPNPVAAHNNIIYVLIFNFSDVGLGCDHLLLCRKGLVFLVLPIPQGSAQVQSSIHSAETDHTSSLGDSIYLLLVLRLMVLAQLYSLTVHTCHRSRVPCVRAIYELRSYQDHVRSTSCMWLLLVLWSVVNFSHLPLDAYNLLTAGLTEDQLVHSHKGLLQGQLVVTLLVVLVCLQLLNEMSFNKFGYLGAWNVKYKITSVSIEDCK